MIALACVPVRSYSVSTPAVCPRPLSPRSHGPAMGLGAVQFVGAASQLFIAPQQKLAAVTTGAVASVASTRVAAWQLLAAFILGGAVSTTVYAAEGLRNAFGTKNVQRGKRLLSLVLKRFWRVTITMIVAACVALVQAPQQPAEPRTHAPPRFRQAGARSLHHARARCIT